MDLDKLVDKFIEKKYLLDMGKGSLAGIFGCSKEQVIAARAIARNKIKYGTEYNPKDVAFNNISATSNTNNPTNILVIGDLHEPFTRPEYFDFCISIYKKHNCNNYVL